MSSTLFSGRNVRYCKISVKHFDEYLKFGKRISLELGVFLLRDSILFNLLHATRWRTLQCVVQQNYNALTNVANALGNIANAFGNNYSTLESVSNGLKYVVTHFQCIFQRIFNAFSSNLLCWVFANRVTYNSLFHPHWNNVGILHGNKKKLKVFPHVDTEFT